LNHHLLGSFKMHVKQNLLCPIVVPVFDNIPKILRTWGFLLSWLFDLIIFIFVYRGKLLRCRIDLWAWMARLAWYWIRRWRIIYTRFIIRFLMIIICVDFIIEFNLICFLLLFNFMYLFVNLNWICFKYSWFYGNLLVFITLLTLFKW
jgi:hypothetical protein